jgi:hypothetical protein
MSDLPTSIDLYEVCPRKDHRCVNLISDAAAVRRLWYGEPNAASNAVDYAKFYSRSHDAVIRVYDESGNVIETQERKGDFRKGKGSTALLIVLNRLRRRFVQFELCAHFLKARGKRVNLLLLLREVLP